MQHITLQMPPAELALLLLNQLVLATVHTMLWRVVIVPKHNSYLLIHK